MNKLNPLERLSAARIRLLQHAPFYGLMANRWEMTPDATAQPLWIDGKTLGFNPEFVEKASFDELLSAMAHCAHHVALLHHLRRSDRDEKAWNIACDVPVNAALHSAGFKLPNGVKISDGDMGKSAEECYIHVKNKQKDKDKQSQQNQQGQGEVRDQPAPNGGKMDQAQREQAIKETMQDVASMAQQAKSSGFGLPGDIEAQLKDMLYPKADWKEVLRDVLTAKSNDDYSWHRPNRRFIGNGLYLPSMEANNSLETLVIAVDTSISISMDALRLFAGAINEILDDVPPQEVYIIYCDSKIQRVVHVCKGDYPLDIVATGRGCTSLCPPFNYIDENRIQPNILLYFTDLAGASPLTEPPYPVYWIDQGDNKINMEIFRHRFGTYLAMKVANR